MSNISVSSVKELRQRTGLGMMDCKKALDETSGDLDKAEDLLRLKSGNKASKLSNRVAAEGCVSINISNNLSYYKKIVPCGLSNEMITSFNDLGIKKVINVEKNIKKIFVKNLSKI